MNTMEIIGTVVGTGLAIVTAILSGVWFIVRKAQKMAINEYRLSNMEDEMSSVKTDVSSLKIGVSNFKSDFSTVKTDVSTLKTDVSNLKTDVSTLKVDVSNLKTDVSNLKTNVSTLKSDVSNLKTDVSNLKTDMSEVRHDISTIKTVLVQKFPNAAIIMSMKKSPRRLNETGEWVFNQVNGKQFLDDNKAFFFSKIDAMKPQTAFDVESAANYACAGFTDNSIFNDIKMFVYNAPPIKIKDEDGKEYFGAYSHLSLADLCVYTTVATDVVFEPVYATVRRNIYLTLAVLFLSVIFVYFFSKTISVPVKKLTEASDQIESGNYILSLESKTRDEIGLLTRRFVKMGKGLDEREKLKDTFGRFINKEIAEKAMKGELALGGETKNVTIFFSDIRSFTAISEKLEPYEVVEFLNEYMTRMVECVNITHGVVDKFIGDAIMGVWGAPVSQGNVSLDALNCVRAALMMRHSLMEFNRGRGGDKKPIIKIGCGINTGPVVAGQIGSSSRMEYTVIGDAVNFASRTEALNKPLGTDILITENTYELIKEHVVVEEMPSVTVKGKEMLSEFYYGTQFGDGDLTTSGNITTEIPASVKKYTNK